MARASAAGACVPRPGPRSRCGQAHLPRESRATHPDQVLRASRRLRGHFRRPRGPLVATAPWAPAVAAVLAAAAAAARARSQALRRDRARASARWRHLATAGWLAGGVRGFRGPQAASGGRLGGFLLIFPTRPTPLPCGAGAQSVAALPAPGSG